MTRNLVLRDDTCLPTIKRALCVLRATSIHPTWEKLIAGNRVGEFDTKNLGFIKKTLIWKSRVIYSRVNPRSAGYMLNLLLDFVAECAPKAQVDLLVEPSLSANIPHSSIQAFNEIWVGLDDLKALTSDFLDYQTKTAYDALVFLYPDAIGLGWKRTERLLVQLGIQHKLVINGRRHVFICDDNSSRALTWRRLLAKSFLVEMALVPAIVFAGAFLALFDAIISIFTSLSGRR